MLLDLSIKNQSGLKVFFYNTEHQYYVLDYKNRKIRQSVKNFQLIQQDDILEDVVLQFGRSGDNSYILDFKFPFSPLQAVLVALSSIDDKIAC
jgi:tubby-related protein 1